MKVVMWFLEHTFGPNLNFSTYKGLWWCLICPALPTLKNLGHIFFEVKDVKLLWREEKNWAQPLVTFWAWKYTMWTLQLKPCSIFCFIYLKGTEGVLSGCCLTWTKNVRCKNWSGLKIRWHCHIQKDAKCVLCLLPFILQESNGRAWELLSDQTSQFKQNIECRAGR